MLTLNFLANSVDVDRRLDWSCVSIATNLDNLDFSVSVRFFTLIYSIIDFPDSRLLPIKDGMFVSANQKSNSEIQS